MGKPLRQKYRGSQEPKRPTTPLSTGPSAAQKKRTTVYEAYVKAYEDSIENRSVEPFEAFKTEYPDWTEILGVEAESSEEVLLGQVEQLQELSSPVDDVVFNPTIRVDQEYDNLLETRHKVIVDIAQQEMNNLYGFSQPTTGPDGSNLNASATALFAAVKRQVDIADQRMAQLQGELEREDIEQFQRDAAEGYMVNSAAMKAKYLELLEGIPGLKWDEERQLAYMEAPKDDFIGILAKVPEGEFAGLLDNFKQMTGIGDIQYARDVAPSRDYFDSDEEHRLALDAFARLEELQEVQAKSKQELADIRAKGSFVPLENLLPGAGNYIKAGLTGMRTYDTAAGQVKLPGATDSMPLSDFLGVGLLTSSMKGGKAPTPTMRPGQKMTTQGKAQTPRGMEDVATIPAGEFIQRGYIVDPKSAVGTGGPAGFTPIPQRPSPGQPVTFQVPKRGQQGIFEVVSFEAGGKVTIRPAGDATAKTMEVSALELRVPTRSEVTSWSDFKGATRDLARAESRLGFDEQWASRKATEATMVEGLADSTPAPTQSPFTSVRGPGLDTARAPFTPKTQGEQLTQAMELRGLQRGIETSKAQLRKKQDELWGKSDAVDNPGFRDTPEGQQLQTDIDTLQQNIASLAQREFELTVGQGPAAPGSRSGGSMIDESLLSGTQVDVGPGRPVTPIDTLRLPRTSAQKTKTEAESLMARHDQIMRDLETGNYFSEEVVADTRRIEGVGGDMTVRSQPQKRMTDRPSRSQLERELADVKQGLKDILQRAQDAGVPPREYDAWLEANRVTGPEAEPKLTFEQRMESAAAASRAGTEARPAAGRELTGEYAPDSVETTVMRELLRRGMTIDELIKGDPKGAEAQLLIDDPWGLVTPRKTFKEVRADADLAIEAMHSVPPGTMEAYNQLPKVRELTELRTLLRSRREQAGDTPTEAQLGDIQALEQGIAKLEPEVPSFKEHAEKIVAEQGEYVHPAADVSMADPKSRLSRFGSRFSPTVGGAALRREWGGAGTSGGLRMTPETRSGSEWDEAFTDVLFPRMPSMFPETFESFKEKNPGATAQDWMDSQGVTYGTRGIPGAGGSVESVREQILARPWYEQSDFISNLFGIERGGEMKGFPTMRGSLPPIDIDPNSPTFGLRATGSMPLGFAKEGMSYTPGVQLPTEAGGGIVETEAWGTGDVAARTPEYEALEKPSIQRDPRLSVNVGQIIHNQKIWNEDERQKYYPVPGRRMSVYGETLRHARAPEGPRERRRRARLERIFNVTIPPMWVSEFENKLVEYGITRATPEGTATYHPESGAYLLDYKEPVYGGKVPKHEQPLASPKATPGVSIPAKSKKIKIGTLSKEGKARMRADVQEVAKEINWMAGYGWVAEQSPDIRAYAALRALKPLVGATQRDATKAQGLYHAYYSDRRYGIGAARVPLKGVLSGAGETEKRLKQFMIDRSNTAVDVRNTIGKLEKGLKRRGASIKPADYTFDKMPQKPEDWQPPNVGAVDYELEEPEELQVEE